MPFPEALLRDLLPLVVEAERDAPLARRTWWRVGGPADLLLSVDHPEKLSQVRRLLHQAGVPAFPLGNASNLLLGDGGVEGAVIRLVGGLAEARLEGASTLALGGGARLVQLLRQAEREGWTGLEALAGIPGTLGGAVKTNAGTHLGELKDRLLEVTLILPDGQARRTPASTLGLSYRHSALPPGAIVASGRLALGGLSPEASRALVAEHLARRAATQPVNVPTCGSTFRNPPGDSAGRLIEAAGLKGFTLGGAQVSPKHANFIVNLGTATAADLRRMVEEVRARVGERAGVWLEPEVQLGGRWPAPWPPNASSGWTFAPQ
jgi:UDP-N-acetylmuramate dehydrogenase